MSGSLRQQSRCAATLNPWVPEGDEASDHPGSWVLGGYRTSGSGLLISLGITGQHPQTCVLKEIEGLDF